MLDELTITVSAFASASWARRARRAIDSLVLLVLLLTVGTGAAYVSFVNHPERINIKQAALLPAPGSVLAPGEAVPTREAAAGDAQNILLVGSDTRGSLAKARSDVIVLMHISKDGRKVHLVHFPGSMYVDVPGDGRETIAAAFTDGGSQLLVRTLQKLVDVPIDHVAVMTFDGLREMTDLLGGVNVLAERATSVPGFGTVRKGANHFDGATAVRFVRVLHQPGESDISRGRRQLAFVKALMLEALSKEGTNPIVLAELRVAVTPDLTLDNSLSIKEMRSRTSALQGLGSKDIVSITAPISKVLTSPKGTSIDIVNVSRMALLSTSLRRDDMGGVPLR